MQIIENPRLDFLEVYPGMHLEIGVTNEYVLIAKMALNAISSNYPAIPKIIPLNSTYDESMEIAVKEFQNIFFLPVTGVIDMATWYEIRKIFDSLKKLAELSSREVVIEEIPGDIDLESVLVVPMVQLVQYFLNVLSAYYASIPAVDIDGILGHNTRSALIEFQKTMNLPATGLIDQETWDTMYRSVLGILRELPPTAIALPVLIFPNMVFSQGMEGAEVFILQELLHYISTLVTEIPPLDPDGVFDEETTAAVRAFQRLYGLEVNGIVEEKTWDVIVSVYRELRFGEARRPGQFPGLDLG